MKNKTYESDEPQLIKNAVAHDEQAITAPKKICNETEKKLPSHHCCLFSRKKSFNSITAPLWYYSSTLNNCNK